MKCSCAISLSSTPAVGKKTHLNLHCATIHRHRAVRGQSRGQKRRQTWVATPQIHDVPPRRWGGNPAALVRDRKYPLVEQLGAHYQRAAAHVITSGGLKAAR